MTQMAEPLQCLQEAQMEFLVPNFGLESVIAALATAGT